MTPRCALSVLAAATVLLSPLLLDAGGGPFAIARVLSQPAEPMVASTSGKAITLAEFAKLVTLFHKMPVLIDEAGFKKEGVDLEDAKMKLPAKRGLHLSTVLHYVLENELPVRATFKIVGDGIFIHPGETQVTGDGQDLGGKVAEKIKASRLSTPGGRDTLGNVLKLFESIGGPPLLVAKRKFKEAGREDALNQAVTLAPQKNAPLGPVLDNILKQANAAMQVKYDYVLIVPTGKKGKK